jgi:DNA-binding MarR family transcriptional regulator
MTATPTAPAGHDLGSGLLALGRSLFALKASPQSFGLDARVDRAGYITLARLVEQDTIRMSDLAALLCLDLSTVSRQVKALEDLGMVARTADPDDRRAYLLEPTPAAREVVADVKAAFSRLVDLALTDWSEDDRQTLTTLLDRLAADLRPERAATLIAAVRDNGDPR